MITKETCSCLFLAQMALSAVADEVPSDIVVSNSTVSAPSTIEFRALGERVDLVQVSLRQLNKEVEARSAFTGQRIDVLASTVRSVEGCVQDLATLQPRLAALEAKTSKDEQEIASLLGVLRTNQARLAQCITFSRSQAERLELLRASQIAHERQCLSAIRNIPRFDPSWLWMSCALNVLLTVLVAYRFHAHKAHPEWGERHFPDGMQQRLASRPPAHSANRQKPVPNDVGASMHTSMQSRINPSPPGANCGPPVKPDHRRLNHSAVSAIRVVEPIDLLNRISRVTRRRRHSSPLSPTGDKPWTVSISTHRGNVRTENQDYGVCFEFAGYQVAMVADGMGGLRYGRQAAYLAVRSACLAIVKELLEGSAPQLSKRKPATLAESAMKGAVDRLSKEGERLGVGVIDDGLRTTLIVVVASPGEFGFAYSGDGGGIIIRADGSSEVFLKPQKDENGYANELSGSLGPVVHGKPESGHLPRRKGDLLVIGSDGVFDRVSETFSDDILRAATQFQGNLQSMIDRMLAELAEQRDDGGYVCDDNMTLAVLGDGSWPVAANVTPLARPVTSSAVAFS